MILLVQQNSVGGTGHNEAHHIQHYEPEQRESAAACPISQQLRSDGLAELYYPFPMLLNFDYPAQGTIKTQHGDALCNHTDCVLLSTCSLQLMGLRNELIILTSDHCSCVINTSEPADQKEKKMREREGVVHNFNHFHISAQWKVPHTHGKLPSYSRELSSQTNGQEAEK